LTLSVHSLACHPLMVFDTDEQRQEWLPAMLLGRPACAGFPALWCQKDTTWLSFGKPEQKMDLRAVPTPPRITTTPTSWPTAASARRVKDFRSFSAVWMPGIWHRCGRRWLGPGGLL